MSNKERETPMETGVPVNCEGRDVIRVRAKIERGCIHLSHCGRDWTLHRPSDLEQLWDSLTDNEFTEDERLPYWVELWPSSLALAAWLEEQKDVLPGARCLDLGCGLGFTALVASGLRAKVIGMDYEPEALTFAQKNAVANAVPSPCWLAMDWRHPAIAPASCQFIWGGDILYEKRFAAPVFAFIDHVLAPDGVVWMAEPGRNTYQYFMSLLMYNGWKGRRVGQRQVDALHVQKVPVTVNIWEVQRQ